MLVHLDTHIHNFHCAPCVVGIFQDSHTYNFLHSNELEEEYNLCKHKCKFVDRKHVDVYNFFVDNHIRMLRD